MRDAILGLGIQTAGDFHHFWPSANKRYEELESVIGAKIEAQEAMRIAVAWTNARRASQQATAALGLEIAQERQSSVGGPPRHVSLVAPAAELKEGPSSNKVRKLTPSGLRAPLQAPLVTHVAALDVHAKEDAAKQAKLDQLFVLVVEHVVDLAELKMSAASLADPMMRQNFKTTLMAGAARLSGQRLGALASALKRWLKYCATHGKDSRSWTPGAGRLPSRGLIWWTDCSLKHARIAPVVRRQLRGCFLHGPLGGEALPFPCSPPHGQTGP